VAIVIREVHSRFLLQRLEAEELAMRRPRRSTRNTGGFLCDELLVEVFTNKRLDREGALDMMDVTNLLT
jgi:hypothetical protein